MLKELRTIVEDVGHADSLAEALEVLVSQVREVMACDCCSVYLKDDNQVLQLKASRGLALSSIGHVALSIGEGVVGLVALREEPINLADVAQSPHFKYFPETAEESFTAFLGTPIIHQGDVLGVLVVQQKVERSYDSLEESFLVTLAAHLASVLRNYQKNPKLPNATANKTTVLHGASGSKGLAFGCAWYSQPHLLLENVELEKTSFVGAEMKRFEAALSKTRDELTALKMRLSGQVPQDVNAIFSSYLHMLADDQFLKQIRQQIQEGFVVASALRKVVAQMVDEFEALNDSYIRERAEDIRELGQRLLQNLDLAQNWLSLPKQDIILVAHEISAPMLAEIPRERLRGIVAQRGSSSSHAAILARAMGVPAVLGVDTDLASLDGLELIVDAHAGEVFVQPDSVLRSEYLQLQNDQSELQALVDSERDELSQTRDGCRVMVLVNSGLSPDADMAVNQGADGVGLYRTEIPFMLLDRFPSEQEQYQRYSEILSAFLPNNVCMRTLDVGGDKELSYFPIIEENPFLGWRGIRLTLDHPEIFLIQARAMYRAALETQNLSVMLPMISSIHEVIEAKKLLARAWKEVSDDLPECSMQQPKTGVMLEVPSLLYVLPELAKHVDFWSVGSNDLTQYLLAVDRNNLQVARLFDSFNPAVVRALSHIQQQSQACTIPVSICGEIAGDPLGCLLLLVLGYSELSMSSANISQVKYMIRRVRIDDLVLMREQILACETAEQIYQYLFQYIHELDLEQFIQASPRVSA
ncbi:phosphoenolpyruvate-protein phosphotransferase PtsP [Alginatibacterium sediminis]|uniref:phosphoenolpyruvate--protein phosphotransferase n=1 Tax=Alginatibacterium sediminis TaxID=2164068 RepID=A0A420EJR5_9ALTE|nr:phosphoenolpyruvate--protein phosphotransferase [Alginatibacterium sediminis]RKF20913.1 phosphoenolpyruvate-protein phosphotransferase PtsP [Alginatibacterium sediminis]